MKKSMNGFFLKLMYRGAGKWKTIWDRRQMVYGAILANI